MKSIHRTLLMTVLVVMAISGQSLAAGLTASVDRTQLSINESLTLTLGYSGQTMDDPDFSELESEFDILSQQKQSKLSFGFGKDSASTEWILALAPKKTGELTIPAIRFKGETSNPVTLSVREETKNQQTQDAIFIDTLLDKEKAYVQSQLLLTLRLHTAVMLNSVEISDLAIPNARVLKIHDSQYHETIKGRDYIVVELKYAIFPESPGTLAIPALTIAGVAPSTNDPFRGSSLFGPRGKPVRLRSEGKTIEVLPKPDSAKGEFWIPARGLSLSQRWSQKPEKLRVGEPVTRTITITAQGLTGAQIPPLELEEPGNMKRYPDQPEVTETLSDAGVLGVRSESVALVPTEPGTITLPPVTVNWWDTETNSLQQTQLDEVTLEILPAEQTSQSTPGVTEAAETGGKTEGYTGVSQPQWLYFSLALNAILAVSLGILVFLLARRAGNPGIPASPVDHTLPTESEAFAQLLKTPAADLALFREKLLGWSRLFWPGHRISTLADVVAICNNANLKDLFTRMDKTLYGSQRVDCVDVAAIKEALKAIRKHGKATEANEPVLKPLYPKG